MKQQVKQDKGTAGLTILLSLVVMLFIIGLLVMIFSLMGSELQDATYTSTTGSVGNESLTTVMNTTGVDVAKSTYKNVVCTFTAVWNKTNWYSVSAGNYTTDNCRLLGSDTQDIGINNTLWNVDYTYTYDAMNTETTAMNDTTSAISGVTDWFDIFVVIGAMVVLILLTVIIITAIKGSGMMGGGGTTSGANSVGTA